MSVKFTAASRKHLEDIHGDLRAVILRAAELSDVKFEISDGRRTLAEQRANLRKGVSKTMKSRHLTGHAVDVLAFRDGKDAWQFPDDRHVSIFQPVADVIKVSAAELGVPVEWGQDIWGWDAPHFQLPWSDYPEGFEGSFLDAGRSYDPARFEKNVSLVLDTEAGWNADDPSMRGVTLETLKRWDSRATLDDLKALSEEKARLIYRALFWHPARGDDLPEGLDYAVFDFAVHSGPPVAVSFLQEIIGTVPDGVFGPLTLAALKKSDVTETIGKLMDARFARMKTLKNWPANRKGWTRRIDEVRAEALATAQAAPRGVPAERPAIPKSIAGYSTDDLMAALRNVQGITGVTISR